MKFFLGVAQRVMCYLIVSNKANIFSLCCCIVFMDYQHLHLQSTPSVNYEKLVIFFTTLGGDYVGLYHTIEELAGTLRTRQPSGFPSAVSENSKAVCQLQGPLTPSRSASPPLQRLRLVEPAHPTCWHYQ